MVVRCRPGIASVCGGPGSAAHRSTSFCAAHSGHERPFRRAHSPATMKAWTSRKRRKATNTWRRRATAASPTRFCCSSSSSWWAAGFGSPMPCSSSAGSTTAWRRAGATARRRSTRRRDRARRRAATAAGARASSWLRRAARRAPPLHALGAFASVRLEKGVEILPPVVVGDLLARLDLLPRAQDDLALDQVGFGVRTARVIGVAVHVAAARAVHGPAPVDLVHVAAAAGLEPLGLRIGDAAPLVFDDERALLDRLGREQPEPGRRAADAVGLSRSLARGPARFTRHGGCCAPLMPPAPLCCASPPAA